jgi:hypothetical protein
MAEGGSLEAFAGEVAEVSLETVKNWIKEYKGFAEAYEVGTGKARAWWEKKARAGEVNPQVTQFFMSNEFGLRRTDDKGGPEKDEVTEIVFKPMSPEELVKYREKINQRNRISSSTMGNS